jgi:hypothetical protein
MEMVIAMVVFVGKSFKNQSSDLPHPLEKTPLFCAEKWR